MKESVLPFIRRGLSETNLQDVPGDQKAVFNRADCDRRICDDFDLHFLKDPKFKFTVFVAELEDGSPERYISIGQTSNPAVGLTMGGLIDFWVEPELRRRGIGTSLLDHALAQIGPRVYSHASIMVSASNVKGLKLHTGRGFVPDRLMLSKKL